MTALGTIKTTQDAINLTIGEIARRMRTGNLTHQMTIQPKVPSKAGKI